MKQANSTVLWVLATRSQVAAAALCTLTLVGASILPAIGDQPRRMALPDQTTYSVVAESGTPEIPFELINNHVVVPLSVNGSESFRVVLDTGMPAGGVVLYGSERAAALELDYAPMRAQVGGAGGHGEALQAQIAMEEQLALPGLEMQNSRVMVLDTPPGFGDYHDGIVGYSLFGRYVVEIDNDASVIRLHESEGYAAPEGAHELPLTLRANMPFVQVDVGLDGASSFSAEVVVDLGAGHAISLNTEESDRITLPQRSVPARLGHGLSGAVEGDVARIPTLGLGGYVLRDVVTSFPVAEHQNPRGMDSMAGNLGNGGRMLLVAGARADEPFEFDMSGLEFAFGADELRVDAVRADSPAARAGVRIDDIVTHIDGKPVSRGDRFGVRERLKTPEEVELSLRRGSVSVKAKLPLRRLI